MSNETATSAASDAAAADIAAPRTAQWRLAAEDDVPTLGDKATALHQRRQRQRLASTAREVQRRPADTTVLITADGAVAFALQRCASGLFVERTQRRPLGAQLVQTMLFSDIDKLRRWRELEPLRFDDPVLYDRLCREGDDALGGKR